MQYRIFLLQLKTFRSNTIDTSKYHTTVEVESVQGANNQYKSNKSNVVAPVAPVKCCNSAECAELYDIVKAEYANLQEEYIELESKRCVEVEKLKNELKGCKSKVEFQKQEIKYLSNKVSKLEKSEKSLKTLLETLKDNHRIFYLQKLMRL